MIITVNSGNGNLTNYLINGTNNSRDREKITILDGNAKLTDSLSKSLNYKDSHFHFIVSANGKRDDEDMAKIYKDFKKELLHSYSKDEVNIFAVLHQDTDNSHIHIQVPKKNLLTDTKLDLYYHKRDLKRFEALRDYLNIKYDETPPNPILKSNPEKNWKYNPSSIKNKLDKKAFEDKLLDYLFENKENFTSHDELIQHMKIELKLDIQKVGYDYKKDDFYLTVQHEIGLKAQRIFSPLFNDGKSKYITENGTKKYIEYDFNDIPLQKQKEQIKQQSLSQIRGRLDAMQEVHKKRVDSRLDGSRVKARSRLNEETNNFIELFETTPPAMEGKLFHGDNIKKESTIKNSALHYQNLEYLKSLNLAHIAIKLYNYKEIESTANYSVIENKTSSQQLVVYKDEKSKNYMYKNLNNSSKGGDIGDFLEMLAKNLFTEIYFIIKYMKKITDFFTDLLELSLVASEQLMENLQQKHHKNHFTEQNKLYIQEDYRSPSRDLKPK